MTPWALMYLSIGLAFFAWMLAYRLDRQNIAGLCDKIGIQPAQRWLIFVLLAAIYAVFWPLAAPLSLRR